MIYVTGDTHGFYNEFVNIDRVLKKGDMCIICGDCGLLFKDDFNEHLFLDDLEKKPYTILFVDGNHENFPAIYKYPKELWNEGSVHKIRKNIIHLCRGQVFTIEGKKFFTFGGGYSLDKASRTSGISWWEQEMPTPDEYEEGKKNLEKHNWSVDYIITHTANIETIKLLAVMDKYNEIKSLANEELPLNFYLEEIRNTVSYKQWYFGHFHRDISIPYTRQTALWQDVVPLVQEVV